MYISSLLLLYIIIIVYFVINNESICELLLTPSCPFSGGMRGHHDFVTIQLQSSYAQVLPTLTSNLVHYRALTN